MLNKYAIVAILKVRPILQDKWIPKGFIIYNLTESLPITSQKLLMIFLAVSTSIITWFWLCLVESKVIFCFHDSLITFTLCWCWITSEKGHELRDVRKNLVLIFRTHQAKDQGDFPQHCHFQTHPQLSSSSWVSLMLLLSYHECNPYASVQDHFSPSTLPLQSLEKPQTFMTFQYPETDLSLQRNKSWSDFDITRKMCQIIIWQVLHSYTWNNKK